MPDQNEIPEWIPQMKAVERGIQKSEAFLHTLETMEDSARIDPMVCLDLFASLGGLTSAPWSRRLPAEQSAAIARTADGLVRRLRALMEVKREQIESGLNEGVAATLQEIEKWVRKAEAAFRERELGRDFTSYEFMSEVLFPWDKVHNAVALARRLGLASDKTVVTKLVGLETKLTGFLPKAGKMFRDASDPIDPVDLEMVPDNYWWWRLQRLPRVNRK